MFIGRLAYCWGLASLAALVLCLAGAGGQTVRQRYQTLTGPVLVRFDDADGGQKKRQFGIFRDEDPPDVQFIEEGFLKLKLPGADEPRGFLVLPYNISTEGTYNGWWLKTGNADWTRYRDGELVLLLRRLDPAADKFKRSRSIKGDDTAAATNFKLELKMTDASGQVATSPVRVAVTEAHRKQQQEKGYFELRVPLRQFIEDRDEADLKRVQEFVLVLENNRIAPTEHRGALGIRGIVLTTRTGQGLDEVLKTQDK